MEHSEAVARMAAERYLLEELTPEEREAFEEHLFDCPDCALDLRAGAAFVDETKRQLPELTASRPEAVKAEKKRRGWHVWLSPAFAVPAFAALLIVIGYQNLVTYPALRLKENQPRIVQWAQLRGATRGGARQSIAADRKHGIALGVELPQAGDPGFSPSYSMELTDPQGKVAWTGIAVSPAMGDEAGQQVSLVVPGAMLTSGAYTLTVSGMAANGERTVIERQVFDVTLTD